MDFQLHTPPSAMSTSNSSPGPDPGPDQNTTQDQQQQRSRSQTVSVKIEQNNSPSATSPVALMLEKKYFDDKQAIKPWLHSQLLMKGINIVIERSDDTKIVFKCKHSHSFASGATTTKSSKSVVKELSKRPKNNCPFRIRANYSLRAKKWSIVVVNDQHNHPVYPLNGSSTAAQAAAAANAAMESQPTPGATPVPNSNSSAQPQPQPQGKPLLASGPATGPASGPDSLKRLNFGPTNSLLIAAQTVNTQSQSYHPQTQSISKFQLPLPNNFNQYSQPPQPQQQPQAQPQQPAENLGSSRSSSSSSSPKPSYSDSTSGSSVTSASSNSVSQSQARANQQQRLNLLHIEINNLLLHLNTSSNLSDANKEEAYYKIIAALKDTLNRPPQQQQPPQQQAYFPNSGTNSPPHPITSSAYSYNYTTNNTNLNNNNNNDKIMLPSLTNSLQGSLQSIRSNAGGTGNNLGINVNSGSSNNFHQFYL